MKLSGTTNFKGLAFSLCVSLGTLAVATAVEPLESYPEVSRIWMGLEEGAIRPAAYQQVRSLMDGYLSLKAQDGKLLKKNELWAVIDPEQIELERESLYLEEQKQKQKMEKVDADLLEFQLSLALEMHEADGKRQTLVDASQDPSIPADLRKRADEAISKMDERINLLRKKADPEALQRNVELEEIEGRLNIARKRKQLLALEKRSHLRAEFDGELRLSDSLKKAVADRTDNDALLWVSGSEHLATIVDDSKFEIVVKASTPVLSQISRDDLLVFLQEPKTGALIAGDYARTDETDTGSEIVQNYIFTISENSVTDARHSSGQRGLVHVYRKFDSPVRLLHKKDLAFAASDVLSANGWDGLVRSQWPDSRVIQIAPQTIAVMPKDDN